LPTYDIFDEYRYFEPNQTFCQVNFKGKKIALTICEDLWFEQPILTGFGKDKLYNVSPMEQLASEADFVINIAASPFSYTQEEIKRRILTSNASQYSIPIVYVNQVGANTDLIFDGGSMVINAHGEVVKRMEMFHEEICDIETEEIFSSRLKSDLQPSTGYIRNIHDALILGITDYFRKMGFRSAVLGLSGGIDSAVTLYLAVKALGNENVRVLLLPSKYSSDHSVTDAVKLAENLKIRYDTITIKDIVNEFDMALYPVFGNLPPDIAEENIQARVRGNLLMAISNKFGNILLNTSNKSEAAVGYGTLYGDMSGGLSVLGDVYKTDVYKLAAYINRGEEIIPENIIQKPPSAELRPDQKDTDSLPEYGVLDVILFNYIERKKSFHDIVEMGIDEKTVEKILKLVNSSEYKRYQTPPILRISSKAFGTGRRMPLVARYSV
ncbi:MAG: NAD+ synthase, partial [Bacteroidales bacterium]|nr:NAD+ synthase [Bacteroidales bacterium]